MVASIAFALVGGGLIVLLGVYMTVTGDCRPLHGYHYATTPPAKRPILAREVGASLVVLGVGVALVCQAVLPDAASVVGAALLVVGIVGMLASIIRHNGGLITSPVGMGFAGLGPRAAMAVCTVMGALLSCVGFVPGAYMVVTGDVGPLHGYHYANVAAVDLPALATGVGIATMGLGAAILLFMVGLGGVAAHRSAPRWAKALSGAGGVLFAVSIAAMLLVIMRYNGSLMG